MVSPSSHLNTQPQRPSTNYLTPKLRGEQPQPESKAARGDGHSKGRRPHCPFIGAFIFAEATLMKISVVAFTTTLMLAGASHGADKITLICSDEKGKDDYSLSIDLKIIRSQST